MQIRGPWGLLDVMERYVGGVGAALVVMGSQQLTSSNVTYVAGSVALSAISCLNTPVMVVTVNSTNTLRAHQSSGTGLGMAMGGVGVSGLRGGAGSGGGGAVGFQRVVALVEGHARGLLPLLCSKLLDGARGDKLMLAQVGWTDGWLARPYGRQGHACMQRRSA